MIWFFACFATCSKYAVLYAGSKEFYNYRHQADIYTIYNQLLARGFTTKQIQLFAYDDIANNGENPFKGQIFHTLEHKTNVYPGSAAIDVKGDNITPEAFYGAITNLPTTSEDYVLIFFNNHGGFGTLGTPVGRNIDAYTLADAFNKASSANLYKKCLFMLEACFAGSVAKIFNAENLATITASNDKELSHAAVYDSQLGCWLTNEFTNSFISIIDATPDIQVGGLYDQLVTLVTQSHATYYGDETIKTVDLSNFLGLPNKKMALNSRAASKETISQREASEMTLEFLTHHEKPSIRARARIEILRRKAQTQKLNLVLDMIVKSVDPKNYDRIMNETSAEVTPKYIEIVKVFEQEFGAMNPDDYGRLSVLKELAATHTKDEIVAAIKTSLQ